MLRSAGITPLESAGFAKTAGTFDAHSKKAETLRTVYSAEPMATCCKLANAESLAPKPFKVVVTRESAVIRTFVTSIPEPVPGGFRFMVPGTVNLQPGDVVTIQIDNVPAMTQAVAA